MKHLVNKQTTSQDDTHLEKMYTNAVQNAQQVSQLWMFSNLLFIQKFLIICHFSFHV